MQKLKNYPKISIVFPNYNGGQEPLDCLKSIKKLNYLKDKIEVVVIDNGSWDGSREQIKKRYAGVMLINNKHNLGFARAINQGLKTAQGDYIFITNDDIIFEKNSLRNLIEYSLKHPNVGILGGIIYKKIPPNEISCAGNNLNIWTGNVYSCPNPARIKEPDWIPGCAMLVKGEVVRKIGLLDDLFTYSFEDSDYCQRARIAGFKVVYLPHAKFWHSVSATANKNRKLTHFHWYQSKLRYALKHLPIYNLFSIFIFQTLAIPPEAILKRDHRILPYTQAVLWNILNLTKTLKARRSVKKPG